MSDLKHLDNEKKLYNIIANVLFSDTDLEESEIEIIASKIKNRAKNLVRNDDAN